MERKRKCTEESFSQRGETSQDIVQDVPVEKTDDPCTTSSGYPPEMKTLKKGTKRGNSSPEKEYETSNKRGKIVETFQDIVQDVPVEKTDDPCTTSSEYPPEMKTLKKGTKRGNSSPEKEDETPNKRGKIVETSQDIVQDVPVEKTDDPCTTSSEYPPEMKTLKKGTKRGHSSAQKEDETPNKRGKIVETFQDIVQDVPVEKTDDPCTTSSEYPPEMKTLKKGTKRGNSSPEKEDETSNKRGKIVETFQDIVQDVPVEKTDDPCTTSSEYPPEMKTLKKGTKRGNSSPEKEDETPNKRGKIVETSQDIVQDVPVEKTDDPCTTSSGHPPEMKTLKKGTKRGDSSAEKEDETPNKRRKIVESESGKDVTSEIRFSASAKTRSSHLHQERVENQSCRDQHKRKRTSDTETTTKRRCESDNSIDQAPEGVIGAQTTSPSEQVTACLSLESFIFTRKLGEGSFGKVMLATHQPSGLQLAVKMVKKRKLLENAKHTIRIERGVLEITEKSRFFTHAYGTFQTADYAFYAMEYLTGGDLTAFIKSRGPLDVCTTRFLAAEILSGIQFLHSRGIIHRDLKPDNILLDGDGHAKIADFGLAAMNVFGSQKISEFCGTPGYMAPEMVRQQPFNYTADLFAFGVMVFQMATGSYPFYSGPCLRRLAYSLQCDEPFYPNTMDSQLRNVIERLLCKSPEKRQEVCSNLKGHPFFSTINWEELEAGRSRPPFTMTPIPVLETSKQMELDQVMSGTEAQKPPITPEDQQLFCGFSYISNRWKNIKSRRNNSNGNITYSPPPNT
ncbi:uncharacterized protein LOC143788168 [Ranitomeya variabilis]|uniref:uncharacterized protein LOC143788168 n=1 Tax=Ranitomeya variabilis TaxID=490064 RepID=UPI004056DB24